MQVHPSQISPAENFDVFYFLRDHTDSTTYYVRAKIYDVKTGELLDTISLSQSSANTRLFITTTQAPPDPTGYGRNIVAIATVYTDSGFTTKSANFEEQEQYFLIRQAPVILGGGGGGIDERTMKELMEAALERFLGKIPKPDPAKPLPEMPFQKILNVLSDIKTAIADIPKADLDLNPVLNKLEALRGAIVSIPPPADPVDLEPFTDGLAALEEAVNTAIEEVREVQDNNQRFIESHEQAMDGFSDVLAEKAEKAINNAAKKIDLNLNIPVEALIKNSPRERKEESRPFNIRQLTG